MKSGLRLAFTLMSLGCCLIVERPAQAQLPQLMNQESPAGELSREVRNDQYLLGANDRLEIEIFNAEEYSGEYVVLPDGTLNLPLVGAISVRGSTLTGATKRIRGAYAEFIRSPSVTLSLTQRRLIQIAIAGEVNRPGAYSLESQNAERNLLTATEAIKMAGGITRRADIRQIQVLRSQPNGSANTTITIDLWQLIESGQLSQDQPLRDGDTVLVPVAETIDSTEATRIATANFSPDSITVYVVGEVIEPGAIELPLNTPLNQALLASGGFTNRAIEGDVELVRLNPNGTVSQQEVAIDFTQDANETGNPILQNNDTIVVSETGLARTSDTLGLVLSPLSGIISLFNLLF